MFHVYDRYPLVSVFSPFFLRAVCTKFWVDAHTSWGGCRAVCVTLLCIWYTLNDYPTQPDLRNKVLV